MTTAGTLDARSAADRVWDAAVIGAGPAGAMAARELARLGCSVVLIDKATFPRRKVCGSCLSGWALATLRDAGLGELASQLGAAPLREVRIAIPGREARLRLAGWAAVSREAFDTALIGAAVQAGAEFLPGCRARLGGATADHRGVLLHQDGRDTELSARVVLAADGLGGRLLARDGRFEARVSSTSHIGAGAAVKCAPPQIQVGTIYMACNGEGYVGLVCVEDGRLNVAAALAPKAIKRHGGVGRAAAAVVAGVGWQHLSALPELDWKGTPALTRTPSCLAVERVFVLGDAAGYVEPFTGEGMAWALASGVAVAPLAHRAARCWEPVLTRRWASLHRRLLARRQFYCRLVARVLRTPVATRALVGALACVPGLATPFLRHLDTAPVLAEECSR